MCEIELFNNTQFIYELNLAHLELKSLGASFDNSRSDRVIRLNDRNDSLIKRLTRRTAYLEKVDGRVTDYKRITLKNRTRSVNQYLTHWIYPYKGKFHPQMVRALINIIGIERGETLLDPFSGSGTAALEAQLLGVNSKSIDVSPLCIVQGRVKTEALFVLPSILEIKDEVINEVNGGLFSHGLDFIKALDRITDDDRVKEFFILARMIALSDESRRNRNFKSSFVKSLNLMIQSAIDHENIRDELKLKIGDVSIEIGDARSTGLDAESIDGIITSPPYSIALDYVQNDAHALSDMGYDLSIIRDSFIGVRGKGVERIKNYNEDMLEAYTEMFRVLKPNRSAVIVVGNASYQGQELDTVAYTIDTMEQIGFQLIYNINKIIFGLYNVMKQERILIFRKG